MLSNYRLACIRLRGELVFAFAVMPRIMPKGLRVEPVIIGFVSQTGAYLTPN